jgi:hypothetical protein
MEGIFILCMCISIIDLYVCLLVQIQCNNTNCISRRGYEFLHTVSTNCGVNLWNSYTLRFKYKIQKWLAKERILLRFGRHYKETITNGKGLVTIHPLHFLAFQFTCLSLFNKKCNNKLSLNLHACYYWKSRQ